MLFRNSDVLKLRLELLDEEYEWMRTTMFERLELRNSRGWRRWESLPSYGRMANSFWVSLKKYRERAGTVESYYPELAGTSFARLGRSPRND